ncbi:hypothetical protein BO94DRAFT_460703 [Aspergillus sclerotioniger CBS 115572]|uniref:Concanavalin A-like lectin/glucanase n=1 Tax=Aspergillus sclerotioniger CBS 115572 TaxID=1450535 RepID=A0A317X2Z8_9EURO|nr:hypothetical protein BO94DRAFT_460703 [Aspergillus sclerotioniger CBS 115572]PWY92999.1 hypothetical protein BO94DRAFT_460703 [Aspergillus sclerotioniger CBS 115572]
MLHPVTLQVVLCSLAFAVKIAAKDDPDFNPFYNFRPNNVTLNGLYYWVGSYYNGTAHVEAWPDAGLAANYSSLCPPLANTTMTRQYDTVLALTEPSNYNYGFDPVNAFLTMWPSGFNFSSLSTSPIEVYAVDYSPYLEFALYSSYPTYSLGPPFWVVGDANNNFDWTLDPTHGPPYTLSSTIDNYNGIGGDQAFLINGTDCNGTGEIEWSFSPAALSSYANRLALPNPTVDLQFDEKTANLSVQGYFYGSPYNTGELLTVGKFRLSFSGVLDAYHSDVLVNNTATPTWLRTVGFNNNSQNVGYTGAASGPYVAGPLAIAAWIFVMFRAVFLNL